MKSTARSGYHISSLCQQVLGENMLNVKVRNMLSRRGSEVPNQFVIRTDEGKYFQSYNSVIAFREFGSGQVFLDESKWDYSNTTSKYRNMFLRETTQEIRKKIEEGVYKLVNLNG